MLVEPVEAFLSFSLLSSLRNRNAQYENSPRYENFDVKFSVLVQDIAQLFDPGLRTQGLKP